MIDVIASLFGMQASEITSVFLFTQAVGVLTTVIAIITAQLKKIVPVMIGEVLQNGLTALCYILLGGFSGSYICIIAIFQTVVSALYARKEQAVPKQITLGFLVLYIAASVYTYASPIDIIPGACAVLFAIAIAQKKLFGYRVFKATNSFLWVVYDLSVGAYTTMFNHMLLLISLIVAMIRYRGTTEENA